MLDLVTRRLILDLTLLCSVCVGLTVVPIVRIGDLRFAAMQIDPEGSWSLLVFLGLLLVLPAGRGLQCSSAERVIAHGTSITIGGFAYMLILTKAGVEGGAVSNLPADVLPASFPYINWEILLLPIVVMAIGLSAVSIGHWERSVRFLELKSNAAMAVF